MATDAEDIVSLTRRLRESEEPLWSRVRQLLVERGLKPSSLALVASFPDDAQFEYGVCCNGRSPRLPVGFDYLHVGAASGTFKEWRDFTGKPAPHPCGTQHIEIGFKVAANAL